MKTSKPYPPISVMWVLLGLSLILTSCSNTSSMAKEDQSSNNEEIIDSSSSSALVLDQSVEELSSEADHIFVGQVQSVQSDWNTDKTSINTTVVFNVEYYLKSTTFQKIFPLVLPGGTVGDISIQLEDVASFSHNDRALIFLNENDGSEAYITGSWQGVYHIDGKDALQAQVNKRIPLSELEELIRESTSTIPKPAYAGALVLKQSIGELTSEAYRIVIGDVQEIESRWNIDKTSIDTYLTLAVDGVLKGEAQSQETLVLPGGDVSEFSMLVGGVPNFLVGERVLLFLDNDSEFTLTGMWQGRYSLSGDQAFQPETGNFISLENLMQEMTRALGTPVEIEDSPEVAYAPFTISCDAWDTTNDTFPIDHWVNPANSGTGAPSGDEFVRLMFDSLNAWQALPDSWVALRVAGTTTRGATNHTDRNNDIAWANLGGGTLGVNWCVTQSGQRIDSDTRFDKSNRTWTITAQSGMIDLRSVSEHEFGHGVGIGHSDQTCDVTASTPLMCPFATTGVRKTILADDSNAAASLYPLSGSAPTAPTGLSANPATNAATLSWTDNASNELSFEIQRAGSSCSGAFTAVGTVSANTSAYTDDDHYVGLSAGTFCFRVKALGQGGDSAFSNTALVEIGAAAEISSPTPGTTLTSSTQAFQWNDVGASAHWLYVGTSQGGYDLWSSGNLGTSTSHTVHDLPTDGSTIHVQLWTKHGTTWMYNNYTYTAFSSFAAAEISSPTPGSTLTSSSQLFQWNNTGSSMYALRVGTSQGAWDIHDSGELGNTSHTVNGLPTDGNTIYVRLITYDGCCTFLFNDYTYTAYYSPTAAEINWPIPGSTLTGSSQLFQWNNTGASEYMLYVGTSQGASDIHDSGILGPNTSHTVNGLPTDGSTIYVRLFTHGVSAWLFNDYTYTAHTSVVAVISSPTPGSTLTSSSQLFQWNDVGASGHWLYVGTSQGGYDLWSSGNLGTNTSHTVHGLPTGGTTIHVRLYTLHPLYEPTWMYNEYTYTAYTTPSAAEISSPTSGSTLTGSSQLFQWNDVGASAHWLYVGTSQGGYDLWSSGNQGTSTSHTVHGLPTDGSTIHVRLWTKHGTTWMNNDYTFTAYASPVGAEISSPTPGSTLTSSSQLFQWNDVGASAHWLHVGTSQGGYDLWSSGNLGTSTSHTVHGLPTDGSTIHVRLWTKHGTTWMNNDYTYTAYASPVGAEISSPTPGSTLTSSSQPFQWNDVGASGHWLYVGTSQGGYDLWSSGNLGTNTSHTVHGLPTDGSTIHVRLWTKHGTTWMNNDYTYTAFAIE